VFLSRNLPSALITVTPNFSNLSKESFGAISAITDLI
jgi:hypothetical protein